MRPAAIPALIAMALLVVLDGPRALLAYENEPTHRAMTERCIELGGLAGYDEVRLYRDLIIQGSVDEDEMPRFAYHFWDPDGGAPNGLPQNSYTLAYMKLVPSAFATRFTHGLDWARDGMPDDLDWHGAIAAYGYDSAARGKAYLALGHVVHMLQDMAQPDHARNRPHPGGHTHETAASWTGSEAFAEMIAPSDRVAYETLWVMNHRNWPRGQLARKPVSLEAAMRELGRKSQATEAGLGLLGAGELALGLARLEAENPINRGAIEGARAGTAWIPAPSLREVLNGIQFVKFRDRFWAHFELNIPLKPLIPWPAAAATKPYLDLGNQLIPLAEEHGAGLIQLFHDIVNHPPIVQVVTITQGDRVKYRKEWRDGPAGRTLAAEADEPLTQGEPAVIRITFGPQRGQPDLHEPVTGIKVYLETGRLEGIHLPGRIASGTGEPVTWASEPFTVQKAGTLCITARDSHAHFEERELKGDALDAQPSTYALARPPEPFDWVGYEPGEDRHHRVNLGGGCGVCAAFARHEETFVSGTLKGVLTQHYENEDGRLVDLKVQATFRCIRVGDPWNRAHQQNAWICDAPAGSYEARWRADSRKPIETFSGTNLRGGASVDSVGLDGSSCQGQGHRFLVSVDSADLQGSFGTWAETAATQGLSQRGEHTKPNGERQTWDLTFEPQPAPAHVTAADIPNPGLLSSYLGSFTKQAWDAFLPAFTALAVAGRARELEELQGVLNAVSNDLGADAEALSRLQSAIDDAYRKAEKAWVYTDLAEGADAKYREALGELTTAVRQWKESKARWEDRFATAVETVAARIAAVNADASRAMKDLAAKLRAKGCESFGEA